MGPALFGAATLLVAAGAVDIMALIARSGPAVGDIISFDRVRDIPIDTNSRILVHRLDHYSCVLDLSVMRQSGGSMIVEARMAGDSRVFHLHWAGDKTSSDDADCGRTADLLVDHRDVGLLSMAAGGYGVGPRTSTLRFNNSTPF